MVSVSAFDKSNVVYVLGAGYSGLTAAAELAINGYKVHVISKDLGFMPPIAIVGTQSRRHPGTTLCNKEFTADDLNDREITTLDRFLALTGVDGSGVKVVPALKVSRKEGVWWNNRNFEGERLAKNRKTNNGMKMVCAPLRVDCATKEAFKQVGYKSIDETPVLCVETRAYFDYLLSVIKAHNGVVSMGVNLSKEGIDKMKGKAIINCLGTSCQEVGGAEGKHYNTTGEILLFKDCPKPFGFYVMDDDRSMGVIQIPNGSLYISGNPSPKNEGGLDEESTLNNIKDSDDVCKAIFGRAMDASEYTESWVGNRPAMEGGGFNVNFSKRTDGQLVGNLNAVGGAGVAASWANAMILCDALRTALTN